ncbi:carboxypeptidase regulatory-like domain-containing protein [Brevibacillus sp. SYSU BS000544]|uniref:carboxypeptidase regulatory-like domain-containing protein n=1 Tax=Brevibacillus sp. SYSU BS000544 TaxID=3416443 RepID=UPI003CE491AE
MKNSVSWTAKIFLILALLMGGMPSIVSAASDTEVNKAKNSQDESVDATGILRGTVTDQDGKGLPGQMVELRSETDRSKQWTANSDADGNFSFSGLPQDSYALSAGISNLSFRQEDIRIDSGKETVLSFPLSLTAGSATGAFEGVVTVSGAQAPEGYYGVSLTDPKNKRTWTFSGNTKFGDGISKFSIGGIPPAEYSPIKPAYTLTAETYAGGGLVRTYGSFYEIAAGVTKDLHIYIPTANSGDASKVLGTVKEYATGEKLSDGNIDVLVTMKSAEHGYEFYPNEGEFQSDIIMSGSYKVRAEVENKDLGVVVVVDKGYIQCEKSGVCNVDFTIPYAPSADNGTLTGVVTDEYGNKVPHALVTVYDSRNAGAYTAYTDKDGNYVIGGLQAGQYFAKAAKDGYPTPEGSEGIIIANQSTTQDIVLIDGNRLRVTELYTNFNVKKIVKHTGNKYQVDLFASYSDGSVKPADNLATWTTSDPAVATVDKGEISVVGPGTATIKATFETKTYEIIVEATDPPPVTVVELKTIPSETTIVKKPGEAYNVWLQAVYSNGTTEFVNNKATWTTSNPAVATINYGTIVVVGYGKATITATYGNKSVELTIDAGDPNTPTVTGLIATPSETTILTAPGDTYPVTLEAIYSDGSKKTVTDLAKWKTDNSNVATVDKGMITVVGLGYTTIKATFEGKSIRLTVESNDPTKPRVTELTPTPSATWIVKQPGDTYAVTLEATYSDGSKKDVTELATWEAYNTEVATVDKGIITVVGKGITTVRASHGAKKIEIVVSDQAPPPATITGLTANPNATKIEKKPGDTYPVTLEATYSDGSKKSVTDQATWTTSNAAVATADKGTITVVGYGTAMIKATFESKTFEVTVNSPTPVPIPIPVTLTGLSASPSTTMIVKRPGDTYPVTLEAMYSDGSRKNVTGLATWTSSNAAVATVDNGTISVKDYGIASIKATFESNTIEFTVDSTIKLLKASKTKVALKPGTSTQDNPITLVAVLQDGSTVPVDPSKVDWKYNENQSAFTVSKDGIIAAKDFGKIDVTASFGGKQVVIQVDSTIKSIQTTVKKLVVAPEKSVSIPVKAVLSDKTIVDLTGDEIDWSIDGGSENFATVDDEGTITVNKSGKGTIIARYGGKTLKIALFGDSIESLSFNVEKLSLKPGNRSSKPLKLLAWVSKTKNFEVTNDHRVEWNFSSPQIVEIDKDGYVVSTGKFGKGTITATFDEKTVTIPIDVTLKKLTASQTEVELAEESEVEVTLSALYTADNDSVLVTEKDGVVWSSKDKSIATVKDGKIKGLKAGETTITASYGKKRVKITVVVKSAP